MDTFSLRFPPLPPGMYIFDSYSCASDNVWNRLVCGQRWEWEWTTRLCVETKAILIGISLLCLWFQSYMRAAHTKTMIDLMAINLWAISRREAHLICTLDAFWLFNIIRLFLITITFSEEERRGLKTSSKEWERYRNLHWMHSQLPWTFHEKRAFDGKKTHLRRRRTGFLLINDYNNLYDRHIKSVRGNPFVNERFSTIEKEENRNTHIFIFSLSDLKYEREESNLTLYIQLSNWCYCELISSFPSYYRCRRRVDVMLRPIEHLIWRRK